MGRLRQDSTDGRAAALYLADLGSIPAIIIQQKKKELIMIVTLFLSLPGMNMLAWLCGINSISIFYYFKVFGYWNDMEKKKKKKYLAIQRLDSNNVKTSRGK